MIKDVLRTLVQNRKSLTGLILLGTLIFVALAAPLLAPYPPKSDRIERTVLVEETMGDPEVISEEYPDKDVEKSVYSVTATKTWEKTVTYFPLRSRPAKGHLLGTNHAGNDLFSQLIMGTRISVFVGLATGLFVTLVSLTLALLAGYLGGVLDDIINFFTNVFLVIPGLPLMIVIGTYIPMHGVLPIILILAFTSWPYPTRVLRSQVLTLKNRDFIRASTMMGERTFFVIFREILPNMISIVMSEFFTVSLSAILAEATLEFIGVGNITVVSWGTILYWAQANGAILMGAWWWFLPPGLLIALTGTAFVLVNFGIDEISNPRLRKR